MDLPDDYAQKIEMMLGCREKADALHKEYLFYLRQNGIASGSPHSHVHIGKFLRQEKHGYVHMYGKPPPRFGGATCLELAVAATLLGWREGARPAVVYHFSPFGPIHYGITGPSGAHFEITGMKFRLQRKSRLASFELSPSEVANHAKFIDGPAKFVKWKSIERALGLSTNHKPRARAGNSMLQNAAAR